MKETLMYSAKNVRFVLYVCNSVWRRNFGSFSGVDSIRIYPFSLLAGCKSDSECPLTQACIDRECQNPCPFERCGVNAECSVRNHRPKCTCLPAHIGNPYDRCRKPECLVDPDCSTTLTCRNEKCVDPCDCARNADCTPRNHRGICNCRPGFTGDPYGIACTPSKDIFQKNLIHTSKKVFIDIAILHNFIFKNFSTTSSRSRV